MDPATEPRPDGNGQVDRPPPPPERPTKQPLRQRARQIRRDHPRGTRIAGAALILLGIAAALAWWYFSSYEKTDDAQIDAHISAVSTRVNGTAVAVYVDDNQEVKAGQLLVELDPRDFQVALARADAELAQARAQLEAEHPNVPIVATTTTTQRATSSEDITNSRAAVAAAERDHQSALARVTEAEANRARAEADDARYRFLLRERAIPEERYDQISATAKVAQAQLDSMRALARSSYKTVEQQRARLEQALSRAGEVEKNAPRQIDVRRATVEMREAAVKAAESAREQARLNLEYTRIVAPISGVVGMRSVEPGQRVQPGEQLLALVALDDVWVTANFKETQLYKLRVGQKVRVRVDALRRAYEGWVESFAGASGARFSLLPPENATGNFVKVVQRLPVRIRLRGGQNAEHRLRPGMSVEPKVSVR